MNTNKEEASTDISGAGKKKRKKYVFLDKFEDFKHKCYTMFKTLVWLHVVELAAIIFMFLNK
jgi:hypothetical protein